MKISIETNESRSRIMKAVKSKNTNVEISIRRYLRAMGFYYRLHDKNLPGTPDIVFKKLKKVIFVNGCFWHGHKCNKGRLPKSNIEFWAEKIMRNTLRDKRVRHDLKLLGWQYLVVWQCELKNEKKIINKLRKFLNQI